jgi:hypothetical protein
LAVQKTFYVFFTGTRLMQVVLMFLFVDGTKER